jgi:hypothetical protein
MLALAAMAAAGAGCTAVAVGPAQENINPAVDPRRKISDGDPRLSREGIIKIFPDRAGNLYADPATHPLESRRLRQAQGNAVKYFEGTGEYDPDQVLEDYAARIRSYTDRGYVAFILIHGFNATMPEIYRSYKVARLQVEKAFPGRKVVFIEVYWDGLYGHPFLIWTQAQNNSKWAGLALRKLLCRLDSRTPVRVLTHSRGAAVVCSALWNTELRGTPAEDACYREAQHAARIPVLHDLRMGLLAPAMRSADFETVENRGDVPSTCPDRIILGINPDDAALNCGGFFWLMGTSLGCTPADFDEVIAPKFNRGRARAFAVDFSGSVEHSFEDYVLRDVFEMEFLPKLMGDLDDRLVAGRQN